MYKLFAKLSNGLTYVTRASSIEELQGVALLLNAKSYWVELHNDYVSRNTI